MVHKVNPKAQAQSALKGIHSMSLHVKIITGLIFQQESLATEALLSLCELTRMTLQQTSVSIPFDKTDYYAPEMGSALFRKFVSFAGIVSLEQIHRWKQHTSQIEQQFSINGQRQVNLDPGYIDLHKLVLLSSKPGSHKVYLADGVWADMTLMKNRQGFETFRWTFPDLKENTWHPFFLDVRLAYKRELKAIANQD
ncbi:MAG: DUF4416 family protein [SAR324 cluster bacterium]|nr:DUF4416 family protein [SAR324 cluster bacterium]